MMMSDNNEVNDILEVYNFQGHSEENVPKTRKLIVNHGVQVLSDSLLWCSCGDYLREVTLPIGLTKIGKLVFHNCKNLLEINKIPRTVKIIGKHAFSTCESLKKVEFEDEPTSPHQLTSIGREAFYRCLLFSRIKPPSSVTTIGEMAFQCCIRLKEANLSETQITMISAFAFSHCTSLQTVSLPNTLAQIEKFAFSKCFELVTVGLPLCSRPLRIGVHSFSGCKSLANFVLPTFSRNQEDSFVGCELLRERCGYDTCSIAAFLSDRFEGLGWHELCYIHPRPNAQAFREYVEEQDEPEIEYPFVDRFEMNPFHIFFSTPEPNMELLELLLDSLPNEMLEWKDANDKRPLDYLFNNWTGDGATLTSLLQRTLQSWMIDPLARWGANSWTEAMQNKVQELLAEDNEDQRVALFDAACSAFCAFEKLESTSVLELALWKAKIESESVPNRQEFRCLCGSDVVLPNVAAFL